MTSRVDETKRTVHAMNRWLPAMLVVIGLAASGAEARELTFAERVEAQAVIARVYQGHRAGRPGAPVGDLAREVLERRVRGYLDQSAALERFWLTPVTAEMLERETRRMVRNTAFPERLRELFDALDHDPVLIQECLARPVLVDRLTRSFFARDDRIHEATRRDAEELRSAIERGALDSRAEHAQRSVRRWRLRDAPAGGADRESAKASGVGTDAVDPDVVDREEFARLLERLPGEVGTAGPLIETAEAFAFEVILERGPESLTVATHVIAKVGRDEWLRQVRPALEDSQPRTVASALADIPTPSGPGKAGSPDCATDDVWDPGVLDDVPDPRWGHTAVWTGSEMIVWGGRWSVFRLNSGGRYDPVTDTWAPISTLGAPSPRDGHLAVWTGAVMMIWGGSDGSFLLDTGALYDPLSDSWTPVSALHAPTARHTAAAVWTGERVILWGGFDERSGWVSSGSLYDPDTDVWTRVSTVQAPTARSGPGVVWSGTEMIVWGGREIGTGPVNTGARYDPASDSWMPMSTVGAPAARSNHSTVFSDRGMLVWGGSVQGTLLASGAFYNPVTDTWESIADAPFATADAPAVWNGQAVLIWRSRLSGGRYDPDADAWQLITSTNAPRAWAKFSVVWTGSRMIVWGGQTGVEIVTPVDSGARYDPMADAWTPTAAPEGRKLHTSVWTGSEMIVWGGGHIEDQESGFIPSPTGGRYDPAIDSWRSMSDDGAPSPRGGHLAIWTGRAMIVWGGGGFGMDPLNTGGLYDPAADAWLPITLSGAPSPRADPGGGWTGREMIVWGGNAPGTLNTGGRYNPDTDAWSTITAVGAPLVRTRALLTGTELLVWGGYDATLRAYVNSGSRYELRTDRWRSMSTDSAPTPRGGHSLVWTGSEMIVWGGKDSSTPFDSGGRYNPATDSWSPTAGNGAPSPRAGYTAVWTGTEMLVWGGEPTGQGGGRYDPAGDTWTPMSQVDEPLGQVNHTAVWAERTMIVWGGGALSCCYLPTRGGRYFLDGSIDDDGDGLSECDGDCNDGAASAFPGAPESCDGLDQDCDGAADNLDADGDGLAVCEDCDDGDAFSPPHPLTGLRFDGTKTLLAWDPWLQGGNAIVYDVLRGAVTELPPGAGASETCLAAGLTQPSVTDEDIPAPGAGYWYLVRARDECAGSFGLTSAGRPQVLTACLP